MTREEAIKLLHTLPVTVFNADYDKPIRDAIFMAIEDMQKQISMKVRVEPLSHDVKINNCTFRKNTRILAICPSCGEWANKHHKHCFVCGQAIDWSEEE